MSTSFVFETKISNSYMLRTNAFFCVSLKSSAEDEKETKRELLKSDSRRLEKRKKIRIFSGSFLISLKHRNTENAQRKSFALKKLFWLSETSKG